jgi:hypothetical protein
MWRWLVGQSRRLDMMRAQMVRLGLLAAALAIFVAAEPRLTLALEDPDDQRPHRFALTGEVMGRAMGVVISWSGGGRQLLR